MKDAELQFKTFSLRPVYIAKQVRGTSGSGKWPGEYGIQLSKSFSL